MSDDWRPDSGAETVNGKLIFVGVDPFAAQRPHPAGSDQEQLGLAVDGARLAVRDLEAKRAGLAADQRLSDVGRREQLQHHALQESLAHLRRLRVVLPPREQRLAEWQARARPFPARKEADVIGEMRDAEIRRWLREQPGEERAKLLRNGGDDVLRAVLGGPRELSGLSEPIYRAAWQDAMRATHGERIAEMGALHESVEAARGALARAERAIREVAGLPAERVDK